MKELKAVFEASGMTSVRTYINSGNVVFSAPEQADTALAATLEAAIEARFGVAIPVLVRNIDEIRSVVDALPPDWVNDKITKCDVFFLFDELDDPSVVDELDYDPEVDDVRYTPGAILRRVDYAVAAKSRLTRIVGKAVYRKMTVRNCNTARKLLELLSDHPDAAE